MPRSTAARAPRAPSAPPRPAGKRPRYSSCGLQQECRHGPHLVVGHLAAARIKRFIELFPEGIDLIVRGLKSGLPITESISTVGREITDPVGIEFRRIEQTLRFGQSLEDALWATARR
ncbi:MAG: hypothetical protein F9K35_19720, partial [Burkholderiaceae bacterium]